MESGKPKSAIIAVILCAVFGPLGFLYFSWRTFLSILITMLLVALYNVWLVNIIAPIWIYMVYFGVWGFLLAAVFEPQHDMPDHLGTVYLCRVYVWLNLAGFFIISIINDFIDGYFSAALLDLLIFMPLHLFIATMIVTYLVRFIFTLGR